MKLTKLEAAQRQLDVAATLFVSDGDPLALHTLAGAAEEILGKLIERLGRQNMFERMRIVAEDRLGKRIETGELSNLINASRNSLKHANYPHEDAFEYDPVDSVVMLLRAMVNYQLASGVLTDKMERAVEQMRESYPSLLEPKT